VAERHFSPAEVERLIPELTRIMDELRQSHADATGARDRLQAEQQRITLSGGGVIDQAQWRADSERLARLAQAIQEGLHRIVGLGGVPKDLGLGLVDFPHLRGGEEVNLCWRHGEREIRYWHGLDEGYANRKPL
jgi:hypothetical protein